MYFSQRYTQICNNTCANKWWTRRSNITICGGIIWAYPFHSMFHSRLFYKDLIHKQRSHHITYYVTFFISIMGWFVSCESSCIINCIFQGAFTGVTPHVHSGIVELFTTSYYATRLRWCWWFLGWDSRSPNSVSSFEGISPVHVASYTYTYTIHHPQWLYSLFSSHPLFTPRIYLPASHTNICIILYVACIIDRFIHMANCGTRHLYRIDVH